MTHDPLAPRTLETTARRATREFLGVDAEVTLLGHSHSAAFRVDTTHGRHLLRIHSPRTPPAFPEFFETAAVESECMWLAALARDTDLGVQVPVPSPTGAFVHLVEHEDVEVPCTLLRWVEGEHVTERRTEAQGRALGELLAALRAHASAWERPADFNRPHHGPHTWRRGLERAAPLVAQGIATHDEMRRLERVIALATEELEHVSRDPARRGLVHGDLHGDNYVERDGALFPIDFSGAMIAPWLVDFAECAGHLAPPVRAAMLDAYRAHWPIDPEEVRHLEGYFVASLVEVFGYHAPDPDERDWLTAAIPAWGPHMDRYLDGRPLLFEAVSG